MKLGNHSVALRTLVKVGSDPRTGADKTERRDVKVDGCLVTPTGSAEPEDPTAAPRMSGYQLLAPPVPQAPAIDAAEAIVWPITGERTVDGRTEYDGTEYQVSGDVGLWDSCQQARLVKTGGTV